MSYISSILLGILQGLTEFFPVSSSGHLVIAQSLIPGFNQPGVLFDVVLHAGTLLAIVVRFRRTILAITKNYLLLILIGTIPAVIVGLFFQSAIEKFFDSIYLVGVALLITGLMNLLTNKTQSIKGKFNKVNAFRVGLAQALAIIPGISRSGSTIFAGTRLGLEKKKAAEFSFLLSIPAVLGANVLQFITHAQGSDQNVIFYLAGFLAAFLSGCLAINIVLRVLLSKKFIYFGIYCLSLGGLILVLGSL